MDEPGRHYTKCNRTDPEYKYCMTSLKTADFIEAGSRMWLPDFGGRVLRAWEDISQRVQRQESKLQMSPPQK
jgi:hypothetical protein